VGGNSVTFTFRDAIDILIVAFVIYRVINAVQGTRVTTLVKGLAIIFGSRVVARALNLQTVSWLLDQATTSVLVALPVVFYPELRRGLEQIGTGRLFARFGARGEEQINVLIHDVVRAAARMSEVKTGALFVFERAISLEEYVQTGVKLDAESSVELFMSIFRPETPLHDGAVILAGGRVASAGSVLPLTDKRLEGSLGTRHRAAVGISEQTDAVVVVVSEETGTISLAIDGRLRRYLSPARLREQLTYYLSEGGEG
jgi:diadenylate cyclase